MYFNGSDFYHSVIIFNILYLQILPKHRLSFASTTNYIELKATYQLILLLGTFRREKKRISPPKGVLIQNTCSDIIAELRFQDSPVYSVRFEKLIFHVIFCCVK